MGRSTLTGLLVAVWVAAACGLAIRDPLCGISRCLFCATNTTCDYCDNGAYCAAGNTQCNKCSTYCTYCNDGTEFCSACAGNSYQAAVPNPNIALDHYSVCVHCADAACDQCAWNNAANCTHCVNGYTLVNGACVACTDPQCKVCSVRSTSCDTCADGYGTYSGADGNKTCVPCTDPKCRSCDGTGACTQCEPIRYTASGGACTQACSIDGCATCASSTQCQAAISGAIAYTYPNATKVVIARPPGCTSAPTTASGNAICTACGGFAVLTSSSTQSCGLCADENCAACNALNPNTCTACHASYFLNGTRCDPCPMRDCLSCSIGSGNIVQCGRCKPPYAYDYRDRLCVPQGEQVDNCLDYNTFESDYSYPNACTQCEDGYGLVTNGLGGFERFDECVDCTTIDAQCTACTQQKQPNGYTLNGLWCTACAEGYKPSPDRLSCVATASTCLSTYPVSGLCQTCRTGQRLTVALACEPCNDPNCATCVLAAGACSNCLPGFGYVNITLGGACTACAGGCLSCNGAGTGHEVCVKCDSGYVRVNSSCVLPAVPTTTTTSTTTSSSGTSTTAGGGTDASSTATTTSAATGAGATSTTTGGNSGGNSASGASTTGAGTDGSDGKVAEITDGGSALSDGAKIGIGVGVGAAAALGIAAILAYMCCKKSPKAPPAPEKSLSGSESAASSADSGSASA